MWSVIILGLIKMLLNTVSCDHLAVYLISEEHNLKKKHKTKQNTDTPQMQGLRLYNCCSMPSQEQTTWNCLTSLREDVEPSRSRKVGSQRATALSFRKGCPSLSLKAKLLQITLCLNGERSYQIILLKETQSRVQPEQRGMRS